MPTLMSQRTPKFLTMLKEDKSDIQHFSNIFSNRLFLWSGGKVKVLTRKKIMEGFFNHGILGYTLANRSSAELFIMSKNKRLWELQSAIIWKVINFPFLIYIHAKHYAVCLPSLWHGLSKLELVSFIHNQTNHNMIRKCMN